MRDDRKNDRELSTADLAEAARDREVDEAHEPANEREIAVPREPRPADELSQRETPLLASEIGEGLRARWTEIQTGFVDEPRRAVEEADALVAEAIRQLAESFAGARASLERDWSRGEDASTEELRRTLQRYRAFFGRLLSL